MHDCYWISLLLDEFVPLERLVLRHVLPKRLSLLANADAIALSRHILDITSAQNQWSICNFTLIVQ